MYDPIVDVIDWQLRSNWNSKVSEAVWGKSTDYGNLVEEKFIEAIIQRIHGRGSCMTNGGENSMDVEIIKIKRIDGQKGLRGIIDVRFGGQVTVFGFRVIEASNGDFFVATPRVRVKECGEVRFRPLLIVSTTLKRAIEDKVINAWKENI